MTKTGENKNEKHELAAVTAEGSLGLLALGAVGIKAWRAKREEEQKKKEQKKKDE